MQAIPKIFQEFMVMVVAQTNVQI